MESSRSEPSDVPVLVINWCKILDNDEEGRCPYAHHKAEEQNKSKH